MLGGRYLGLQDVFDLGLAVTDSCHSTHNSTITGLGPLEWGWFNSSDLAYVKNRNLDAASHRNAEATGFFITSANWESRPETIESIFYAYRLTGDPIWQEYAWQIFLAINETAANSIAFAEVGHVNAPYGPGQSSGLIFLC